MDGELSAEAGRVLTRRMGSDESLNATWRRYHLIRDCLRRPGESVAITRLTVDIERLGHDAGDDAGSATIHAMPAWLRPVAGAAIAASVATVAILVVLDGQPVSDTPDAEPFTSPNTAVVTPLSEPASYPSELGQYLRRHNQVTGAMGEQGMVILVPTVPANAVQVVEPAADSPADDDTADAVRSDDS